MRTFSRYIPGVIILFVLAGLLGWQFGKKPGTFPDVLGETQNVAVRNPAVISPTPVPGITLTGIFVADHSWAQGLPRDKTVTMIVTGDVIPARSVNHGMVKRNNFRWPFEKTADVLASADLTVINLETPLMSGCTATVEGMIFCGNARATDGLAYAGVDVATLGNNHVGNYFAAGVEETKKHLTDAGISPVSSGITYKNVKGTTFAFLAYNDIGSPEAGVPWADEATIRTEITEAKKHADIVIVAYHWGMEYVSAPTERQQELAHVSVDSGADVVLGNHPHWIQPVELYKNSFIIYAHGNFVFDQEWSEETKRGVVGRYTFYDGKLIDVEYLPVRIIDYGQPYFLAGAERQTILDTMQSGSINMVK